MLDRSVRAEITQKGLKEIRRTNPGRFNLGKLQTAASGEK